MTSSSSSSAALPPPGGPAAHHEHQPPKSKREPYYAISPLWSDIKPIPQVDLDDPATKIPGVPLGTGPALATIMYTPRYTEAMAYLRAVMADNEYSTRVLALTEDVIGMNPAHYTVWLYRFRTLRELWGVGEGRGGGQGKGKDSGIWEEIKVDENVIRGVQEELRWLEKVSERHLKNYQIWHHRNSLVSLLPSLPSNELAFLNDILTLDTKNYHVWSYRQWLCTKFPTPLLTTEIELEHTASMLEDDVRNNSAWNHRYFVALGHRELAEIEARRRSPKAPAAVEGRAPDRRSGIRGKDFSMDVVDLEVVERELDFVKHHIRRAPQNVSSWNYLRGVLRHAGIDLADVKDFAGEFVGEDFDFETAAVVEYDGGSSHDDHSGHDNGDDDNIDTTGDRRKAPMITVKKRGVRSSYAVEVLIDIFEADGTDSGKEKVRRGLATLGDKWDPIRKNYWEYRLKRAEERWLKEERGEGDLVAGVQKVGLAEQQ